MIESGNMTCCNSLEFCTYLWEKLILSGISSVPRKYIILRSVGNWILFMIVDRRLLREKRICIYICGYSKSSSYPSLWESLWVFYCNFPGCSKFSSSIVLPHEKLVQLHSLSSSKIFIPIENMTYSLPFSIHLYNNLCECNMAPYVGPCHNKRNHNKCTQRRYPDHEAFGSGVRSNRFYWFLFSFAASRSQCLLNVA